MRSTVGILAALATLVATLGAVGPIEGSLALKEGGSVKNANKITIPRLFEVSPKASPYPSSVEVTGFSPDAVLEQMVITLHELSHANPDDMDILLEGPDGQAAVILSDAGGATDVAGATVNLDSSSATPLPDNGPLTSGTYYPSNVGAGDVFLDPAPGLYRTDLNAFMNKPVNGTWRLFVIDDNQSADDGQIAGGWELSLIVNEAPLIGLPSAPATFVENGPPVQLDGAATFVDVDTLDFDQGYLSVTWADPQETDLLAIRNQGSGPGLIGIANDVILYDGVGFAVFDGGDGVPLEIHFTSPAAKPPAIQALLRNLVFSVGSEDPPPGRLFTFLLESDDNESGFATASKSLVIEAVPDAPSISPIPDATTDEDSVAGPFAFTIADVDTSLDALTLSGASTRQSLLRDSGISFGGKGTNRTITLTPAPNANGTTTVTVTVSDGRQSSSERFTLVIESVPDPTRLTVRKRGNGGGTVKSVPAGIACGPDCSHAYEVNTKVKLEAVPRRHSLFRGWSGPCSGRGDCVIELSAAVNVTAHFVRPRCGGDLATRVGAGVLEGTPRDDVLVGSSGPDQIDGRGGDDRICSLGGADVLRGGPGNDSLFGGGGADRLFGLGGSDRLYGQDGGDVLRGGAGPRDVCDGGPGTDTLRLPHGCEEVIGIP